MLLFEFDRLKQEGQYVWNKDTELLISSFFGANVAVLKPWRSLFDDASIWGISGFHVDHLDVTVGGEALGKSLFFVS